MAVIEGTRATKTWTGHYSFAIDGGAEGAIVLRSDDGPIPNDSYVTGGFLDVMTSCASATGTMALHVNGANDLISAAGEASYTAGHKDIVPDGTGTTAIQLTAARNPTLTIATAAFTAGIFRLVLFYK
jgi:hypothetical protein